MPWYNYACGLDLSDSSIKLLAFKDLSLIKDQAKVAAWVNFNIPLGLIEDGIVRDTEALTAQIIKAKNVARLGPTTKNCVLSLPSTKIFSHLFTLPADLNHRQIAEILQYESQDFLTLPQENIYYDFLVLRNNKVQQEVLFVSAPKEIVDPLKIAVKRAGLNPLVFEIEALSGERALMKKYLTQEAVMLIDMGDRLTSLTIFDRYGVKVVINLAYGGQNLTLAIAQKLGINEKEARALKQSIGLSLESSQQVAVILQQELQIMLEEIKKTLDYFGQRYQEKISKIILTGGSALLLEITNYFQQNLHLPVALANPWLKVDFSDPELTKAACANVFGLALRGSSFWALRRGLNLLKYTK